MMKIIRLLLIAILLLIPFVSADPPEVTSINITYGTNYTVDYGTADADGDSVTTYIEWFVNRNSILNTYLPFDDNSTCSDEYEYNPDVDSCDAKTQDISIEESIWVYNTTYISNGGRNNSGVFDWDGIGTISGIQQSYIVSNTTYLTIDHDENFTLSMWVYPKGFLLDDDNGNTLAYAKEYLNIFYAEWRNLSEARGDRDIRRMGMVNETFVCELLVQNSSSAQGTAFFLQLYYNYSKTNLNTWSHIACSFNGTAGNMYFNGSLVDTYPFVGWGNNQTYLPQNFRQHQMDSFFGQTVTISGEEYSLNFAEWNGSIDDIRYYDRALSNEQIAELFNENDSILVEQEIGSDENWGVCITAYDGTSYGTKRCTGAVSSPAFSTISVFPYYTNGNGNVDGSVALQLNITDDYFGSTKWCNFSVWNPSNTTIIDNKKGNNLTETTWNTSTFNATTSGSWSWNVSCSDDFNNSFEYEGQFGVGIQNEINHFGVMGNTTINITFTENENHTINIGIPEIANVSSVYLNLSGYNKHFYCLQDKPNVSYYCEGVDMPSDGSYWFTTHGGITDWDGSPHQCFDSDYTTNCGSFNQVNSLFINYSKPKNVIGGSLNFTSLIGASWVNFSYSIPDSCWNWDTSVVALNLTLSGHKILGGMGNCRNTTGWQTLYSGEEENHSFALEIDMEWEINLTHPSNTWLEVGTPDGTYEWEVVDNFSIAHNQTRDFGASINSYLSSCSSGVGNTSTNNCSVPFLFHSGTSGIVNLNLINITYDWKPLIVTNVSNPEFAGYGDEITLQVNVSDLNAGEYISYCNFSANDPNGNAVLSYENASNIDNNLWNSTAFVANVTGIYTWNVSCVNSIGLSSFATSRFSSNDSTPPTIIINLPTNGAEYTSSSVLLDINVTDDLILDERCIYQIDSGGNTTIDCSGSTTLSLGDGTHTIRVYGYDVSGNENFTEISILVNAIHGGASTSGGSGGGKIYVSSLDKNFSIKSELGSDDIQLIITANEVKEFTFLVKNTGDETLTLNFQCVNSDICDWVTFEKDEITIQPSTFPTEIKGYIDVPTVEHYSKFNFNILATTQQGKQALLVVDLVSYPSFGILSSLSDVFTESTEISIKAWKPDSRSLNIPNVIFFAVMVLILLGVLSQIDTSSRNKIILLISGIIFIFIINIGIIEFFG